MDTAQTMARPAAIATTTPSAVDARRLYAEHAPSVFRALRRGGIDDAAIDDCAQEVFLIAIDRWRTRQASSSTRGWLIGIARNVASHHRRARDRSQRRELAAAVHEPPPGPDQLAEVRARLRFVEAFLAGLSEDFREVFVLTQIEEIPAPEVAELLGLSVNTVYTRVLRTRRAFEAALAERDRSRVP